MRKKIILSVFLMLTMNLMANEQEYIRTIDKLYKDKNFQQATKTSKEFLDRYPSSRSATNVRDKLAKVYFLNKNYSAAISEFRILLLNEKKDSRVEELAYYLARSNANLGQIENTRNFFKLVPTNSKYYSPLVYELGIDFINSKKYKEANFYLEKAISENNPNKEEATLNLALSNYNLANYSSTEKLLDAYKRSNGDKNYTLVNYTYGMSAYKKKNIDRAIKYLTNVVNYDAKSSYGRGAILALIEIYISKGEVNTAYNYVNKLAGTKEHAEGILLVGDFYLLNESYKKALSTYNEASTTKNLRINFSKAYSYFKLEEYDKSRELFNSLLNTQYKDQATYYLANIAYKDKKYQELLDQSSNLLKLKLKPEEINNIKIILANSAFELGHFKLSKEYHTEILSTNLDKDSLYNMMLINSKLNDLDSLISNFKEYREKYPDDTDYKKRISLIVGEALSKAGAEKDSVEVYETYLKTDFDYDILTNLMIVLINQKDYKKLETYIPKIKNPNYVTYIRALKDHASGKYKEAEDRFAQIKTEGLKDLEDKTMPIKVGLNRMRNFFLWSKYEEAIKISEELLKIKDLDEEIKVELLDKSAISYFRLKNFEKSRELYEKIKKIEPNFDYASFQIADSYYTEKKYEEARKKYIEIYIESKDESYREKAYFWYINTFAIQNDFDNFVENRDKFMEEFPASSFRNNILSLSNKMVDKLQDKGKKVASYEDVYKLSKDTKDSKVKDEALVKIIEFNIKEKNVPELEKNVVRLETAPIKAYYTAIMYEMKNDLEAAAKEYKKIIDDSSYADFANTKLGTHYYKKKDFKNARLYYEKSNKLKSNNFKDFVLYQLANIDAAENKNKEALAKYTEVYTVYKGKYYINSKFKAAELYEKLSKEKDAFKIYKELYSETIPNPMREFILEKLIFFSLKDNNKNKAKEYHEKLKFMNKEKATKYDNYFIEEVKNEEKNETKNNDSKLPNS